MTDGYGALQIHTVEPVDERTAVCVVRCVGGVARPGQGYDEGRLRLEAIDRYGRDVDLVDPPHGAKVRFSGDGVARLRARTVIATHGPAASATWALRTSGSPPSTPRPAA